MEQITNDRMLKLGYEILRDYKEWIKRCPSDTKYLIHKIIKIKRNIRQYNHQVSDRRLLHGDFDGCMLLIECPDWVKDKESAEYWFENKEYIPIRYSAYDCTGRFFTEWHKCFERNGKWMCYHCIGIDV